MLVPPRRFGFAAILCLLTFIALLFYFLNGTSPRRLRGPFKEPNLELIDEPPGPLRRIHGNNYAASNPNSDRLPATLFSLVRNADLERMLKTMQSLETTFNHKFNYPWTFFSPEVIPPAFQLAMAASTSANISFHKIPATHWSIPPWINADLYAESQILLAEQDVRLVDSQAARWHAGPFARHEALHDYAYVWRIRPGTSFYCNIDYDPFAYLEAHNKTYGFALALRERLSSAALVPQARAFLAAPGNAKLVHKKAAGVDKGEEAGLCAFGAEFEIASLALFRGDAYTRYFAHLDRAGGFFYEGWSDVAVRSLAVALFESREGVHWFRDVGVGFEGASNCPSRPAGRCLGCRPGIQVEEGKDCRKSWFERAGYGEWGKTGDA